MTLSKVIIIGSHFPILLTAVYAAFCYRRLDRELRLFSLFVFFSAIVQGISLLLWFRSINNLPLLHVYTALGFMLLALFYRELLRNFIDKRIIEAAALLFLLFSIANTLFLQPLSTFNSYALSAESVLVVILSLFTYMLLLDNTVKEQRRAQISSLHWINSGLFVYYSSNLIIFYFGDLITHSFPKDLNRYTWILHSFFSVVMYICFFTGLWKRPKR
ncbi:MAG: hypothetical protein IBJ09_04320 [Bacteroidia bacterium]|nr:hypothetical protein [Bacteroidia bacterium]